MPVWHVDTDIANADSIVKQNRLQTWKNKFSNILLKNYIKNKDNRLKLLSWTEFSSFTDKM